MNVIFRRAKRSDVLAIVTMLAEDGLGSQRECLGPPLPPVYYSAFEAIDKDPNHELVVAELEREVIGTAHIMFLPSISYQGGTRAQVESVRVAQSHRNKGIGRAMMEWAIALARRRGCHLMKLTSHKSRVDAHRFYEKLGFEASHLGLKIDLE